MTVGSGQSASGAAFRSEEVPVDLTKHQFVKLLRRAGYPDVAQAAARALPDPPTIADLDQFCTLHGLSRSSLMDRMGGSP